MALRQRRSSCRSARAEASTLNAETEGESLGNALLGKEAEPHSLVAELEVSESVGSGAGSGVRGASYSELKGDYELTREVVEGTLRSLACRPHGHPARRSKLNTDQIAAK